MSTHAWFSAPEPKPLNSITWHNLDHHLNQHLIKFFFPTFFCSFIQFCRLLGSGNRFTWLSSSIGTSKSYKWLLLKHGFSLNMMNNMKRDRLPLLVMVFFKSMAYWAIWLWSVYIVEWSLSKCTMYILQLVAIVTFFMFFSVCSFIISCWTIWIEWTEEKIAEQNGAMAQNIWPKRQGTTSANMRQLRINIER